jgi:hypothetical protein
MRVLPQVRVVRLSLGLIVVAAGLLSAGCGNTASESTDKGEALALLRTVLEAWQMGEKPESLRERSEPIWVTDPAWMRGTRLTKFEIEANQTQLSGYNVACPVKLWLNDGKKEPRKVKFTVATAPALVVAREFGG